MIGRRSPVVQWCLLALATTLLSMAFQALHAPAALLLAPLAAGLVFGVAGAGVRLAPVLFSGAQAVVGMMIAMAMTPALLAGVAVHWPVYLLMAVATLACTAALGWAMTIRGWLPGTTALWGLAPGASTAMVLMADAFGGDRRLVALMQYLRILVVAFAAIGFSHTGIRSETARAVDWFAPPDPVRLGATLALTLVCALAGRRSRLPAGVFLAPMLVGAAFQYFGWLDIQLQPLILATAYAMIGWTIGLSFTPAALAYGARALPRMAVAIAAVIAACGLIAAVASAATGADLLSAYLAASPGGTDTIMIIAASTPVDLPFILGAQLTRFLLVLALAPPLARMLARRSGPAWTARGP